MICSFCGNEYSPENFDMCPYCLTPSGKTNEGITEEDVTSDQEEIIEETFGNVVINEDDEYRRIDLLEDDYEVTQEDLEEDAPEEELEEVLISELGLSVRAVNALRRARIHTLNELILFLSENSLSDLRNVGAKTVKETEDLLKKVHAGKVPLFRKAENCVVEDSPKCLFENMSVDLDYLSIDALMELGLTHKMVNQLIKNDIQCCGKMRFLSKLDLEKIFAKRYFERLSEVAELLEKDIISLLEYVLASHRGSREFDVFLRRSKGETLQEIASNPRENEGIITRERVRQIERTFANGIMPFIRELFFILKGANTYLPVQDILDVYDDDEYDQILVYACKAFGEFEYLDFADLFVEKQDSANIEYKLLSEIKDIVGDGVDLYDSKEEIESVLEENHLDFISIDSIIRLLRKNNYHVYGNFVVKGRTNYATICMHIIRTLFADGIKLSQSETEKSEDLMRLRKIVAEGYRGLALPDSDRALSSTLTRSGLILRGRGVYIAQEFVSVDESLIQEIKSSIDAKPENKVFYNELFADYEGALNALCGVDNYNYLHGILSMYYPHEYEYSKDYLLKNGVNHTQAESISDRIYDFIVEKGRPISKAELLQQFRGFSNVMLTMPFTNDSRLLQWEYNYYTCTGLLDISAQDIVDLENCIVNIQQDNKGYTSDVLLFECVLNNHKEFIEKNNIQNEMNLHYVVANLFSNEFDFRRPHILKKGIMDVLTTKNIILYLLNNPEEFTYEQYISVCDRMKWSRVTVSATLPEIEEDYDRISVNGYLRKDCFTIGEDVVSKINVAIKERVENGILPLINIDLDDFPDIGIDLNEFMLETMVKKYCNDYDVIHPVMKDRRYQRGILVDKSKNIKTYPQIVASVMDNLGYREMPESHFLSFLLLHNLARKVIPSELEDSDYIKKDGENYVLIM